MKTRLFATLGLLTLSTAATALAESKAVMAADIPFEFRVGTTVLPAGHYAVRSFDGMILSLRSSKAEVLTHTNGVFALKAPELSRLVFERYDKTYFLSRLWTTESDQGRELRKTKVELELARTSPLASPVGIALARQ